MKKIMIMVLTVVMTLSLCGCGEKDNPAPKPDDDNNSQQQTELKEPELTYWMIKNNNGIPTLCGKFYNPNKKAVDLSFDVDFYKDGKLISTAEEMYYNCLPAKETAFFSNTWEIPEAADEIKIRYTYLGESTYTPLAGKTLSDEPSNRGRLITFSTDKDYSNCTAIVVFYYNKEVISYIYWDVIPGEKMEIDCELVDSTDSHEIFYNIYK